MNRFCKGLLVLRPIAMHPLIAREPLHWPCTASALCGTAHQQMQRWTAMSASQLQHADSLCPLSSSVGCPPVSHDLCTAQHSIVAIHLHKVPMNLTHEPRYDGKLCVCRGLQHA